MNNKNNETSEVVIPKGYSVEEILDINDDVGEEPILTQEVILKFE